MRLAASPVAPQLTVVSGPPLNEAFQCMRETPTLLGWGPARRHRHATRALGHPHVWKGGFVDLTPDQQATFRKRLEGVGEQVATQVAGLKE